MNLRWCIGIAALLTGVLTFPAAPASAGGARTLVVDDDGVQCPNASYTVIQRAIDAAATGDTIRVCGGTYTGDVTIGNGKSVTLTAQTPAAPAIDCLAPAASPFPADVAVVQGAVFVSADNVRIDGLAVTTAPFPAAKTPIGITTEEEHSGYEIRRTVVQDTGRFGIELQSRGDRRTVVEKNCLRRNGTEIGDRGGLVSESGALRNAVIQKNLTADNFEGISVAGPHPHADLTITKNVLRRESLGIFVSGVISGEVSQNDIDSAGATPLFQSIVIGGGNVGLVVDANSLVGGVPSISINRTANYTNPDPNVGVVISRNSIRNSGSGINVAVPAAGALPNLSHGLIYGNDAANGSFSGIVITPGNNDNILVGNRTTDNARYGIWLAAVPGLPPVSGTMAIGNTMLGNTGADVRDDAFNQNTWINNRCVTQIPADATICGTGREPTAESGSPAGPVIPPPPAVDQSQWPCLHVPSFAMNPDGSGKWTWTTVIAPDAPPDTYCGS
jgi:hypothetical protein